MLKLHLVVKQNFVVVDKLIGPIDGFMTLLFLQAIIFFACNDVTDDVNMTSFLRKNV